MAGIDTYLSTIKNNIYGEDIRMAIYNALVTLNNSVTSSSNTSQLAFRGNVPNNTGIDIYYSSSTNISDVSKYRGIYRILSGKGITGLPDDFDSSQTGLLIVLCDGTTTLQELRYYAPSSAELAFTVFRRKGSINTSGDISWSTWFKDTTDSSDNLTFKGDVETGISLDSYYLKKSRGIYRLVGGNTYSGVPSDFDPEESYLFIVYVVSETRNDVAVRQEIISLNTSYEKRWSRTGTVSTGNFGEWIDTSSSETNCEKFMGTIPVSSTIRLSSYRTSDQNGYYLVPAISSSTIIPDLPSDYNITMTGIFTVKTLENDTILFTRQELSYSGMVTSDPAKVWVRNIVSWTDSINFIDYGWNAIDTPQIDYSQVTQIIGNWLTAHPEATTTVEDNSLDLTKFALPAVGSNALPGTDYASLYTSVYSGYPTPQMYGVKGDGTDNPTFVTTVLQEMINAYRGRTIYIPAGLYRINATLKTGVVMPDNTINEWTDIILDPSAEIRAVEYMDYMLELGGASTATVGSGTMAKKIIKGGIWNSNGYVRYCCILVHDKKYGDTGVEYTTWAKDIDISDMDIWSFACDDNDGNVVCTGLCLGEADGYNALNDGSTKRSLNAYVHHVNIINKSVTSSGRGLIINAPDNNIDNVRIYYFYSAVDIYRSSQLSDIHTFGTKWNDGSGDEYKPNVSFRVCDTVTVHMDQCYADTTDYFLLIMPNGFSSFIDMSQSIFYQESEAQRCMRFIEIRTNNNNTISFGNGPRIRVNGLYYNPNVVPISDDSETSISNLAPPKVHAGIVTTGYYTTANVANYLRHLMDPRNVYLSNIYIKDSSSLKMLNGDLLKGAMQNGNGNVRVGDTTMYVDTPSEFNSTSYWYKLGTFMWAPWSTTPASGSSTSAIYSGMQFRLSVDFERWYFRTPWIRFGYYKYSSGNSGTTYDYFSYNFGSTVVESDDTKKYQLCFMLDSEAQYEYSGMVPVTMYLRMYDGGTASSAGSLYRTIKGYTFENTHGIVPSTDIVSSYGSLTGYSQFGDDPLAPKVGRLCKNLEVSNNNLFTIDCSERTISAGQMKTTKS